MSTAPQPLEASLLSQRLMWVAWPAFMVACLLEMLVFAVVDPESLHWFGQAITISNIGVYTIAFFLFWVISALSGMLTLLLAQATVNPDEIRSRSEE